MKRLICEMCGSVDLVKQDGFFMCQSCGCKYSVEEAKKMMIEGTVEFQGTVKLDDSEELQKLYQAARNARQTSDTITATRHYESISAKDPNSWEALFYLVVLKTTSIKNAEISAAAIRVTNSLGRVFQLIKQNVAEEAERKAAVQEVVTQCFATATWLTSASQEFCKTLTKGTGLMAMTGVAGAIISAKHTGNARAEDRDRCFRIANLMCCCGNAVEAQFDMDDEAYRKYAVWSWKKMLEFNTAYRNRRNADIFSTESIAIYATKIKKYDPDYTYDSSIKEYKWKKAASDIDQKRAKAVKAMEKLLIICAFLPIVSFMAAFAAWSFVKMYGQCSGIRESFVKKMMILGIITSLAFFVFICVILLLV